MTTTTIIVMIEPAKLVKIYILIFFVIVTPNYCFVGG